MQLSEEGYRLAKSFEGYHRELPDGSCVAYRCPSGILTQGFGCTEGVVEGEVWTREEAEARLRVEIAKHEAAVLRLVTVEINQNQFDALVLFSYNVGFAKDGLGGSTLLKRVNAREWAKASKEFERWTKGTVDGKKVDLPGLVSRRKREASLFLKPVEAPSSPGMPGEVFASPPLWKLVLIRLGLGSLVGVPVGTAAVNVATEPAPLASLPPAPDPAIVTSWQTWGETLASVLSWSWHNPNAVVLLAAWVGGSFLVAKYWRPST